ncbi:MAG: MFS transporter [Burkholderiaceae bacterium]
MTEPRYGWVVVWAAFVSMGVIFGVAYSFAAFFESFAQGFAAQRADVAMVFGLCGLIYFGFGAFAGMLSDRLGPRLVCGAGMLCIAVGLFATSAAQSMGAVYITWGVVIGLGVALVYTPSIACVQPWFTTRRGFAAGIASAGIGAGTLVVPLLVVAAISLLQWRDAMRLAGVAVLLVGLVATLLLKRAPGAIARTGAVVPGLTLGEALRTRRFQWLYLSVVLAAPPMFTPFAHASAAARDMGISDARAVGLLGLIGIGSLAGRFAIGALADRLGRSLTMVLVQASMGASLLLWQWSGGYVSMALFAVWFGLSYGGIVSLLPALCMDFFGARAVAAIIGTLYTAAALGNLLGPVLAGMAFDQLHSYGAVIWVCISLSVAATLASLRVHRESGNEAVLSGEPAR